MDKKIEIEIGGKPSIVADESRIEVVLCGMMMNKIESLATTFEVDLHMVVMATLNAASFTSDRSMNRLCKEAGLPQEEVKKNRIRLANLLVEAMRFISENGVIKQANEECGNSECEASYAAHHTTTEE